MFNKCSLMFYETGFMQSNRNLSFGGLPRISPLCINFTMCEAFMNFLLDQNDARGLNLRVILDEKPWKVGRLNRSTF